MPSLMPTIGVTQPINSAVQFAPADGVIPKTLYSAAVGPYRITSILVATNSPADVVIDLYMHVGSTNNIIGSFTIPASRGTGGQPSDNLLAGAFPASVDGIDLLQANQLFAAMEVTLGVGLVVYVTVLGGLY
jgi:hypothetical protein